jgi:hypothetical protein
MLIRQRTTHAKQVGNPSALTKPPRLASQRDSIIRSPANPIGSEQTNRPTRLGIERVCIATKGRGMTKAATTTDECACSNTDR